MPPQWYGVYPVIEYVPLSENHRLPVDGVVLVFSTARKPGHDHVCDAVQIVRILVTLIWRYRSF